MSGGKVEDKPASGKNNAGGVRPEYTFVIALIIISAYIVFFGVVMYQNPTNNYEGLKTITATFGTIVAAVVGYYFGQRPAQEAIQSAQLTRGLLKKETGQEVEHIDEGLQYYDNLDKDISSRLEKLNSLLGTNKNGQNV